MSNLTIKNVPPTVVRRLKAQASRHRRSLNLEVITCLESATQSTSSDVDSLLARIRRVRQPLRHTRLTDRLINRLKTHGRP